MLKIVRSARPQPQRCVVEVVARDQALSVERRASMQRVADTISARLDSHEKAILDLQRWRDEAAGAIRLARWALGALAAGCCYGAPDRCWARVSNLRDPDRGSG